MKAEQAMGPAEFRFTDPQDVEKFGDGWHRYAEEDLIRLPARRLIELEAALGMPLTDAMNGMRMRTVLGDTAAAWLGLRLENPDLAGDFDEFNPLVMLITWRPAEGKAPAGTEPEDEATQPPAADGSPAPSPSSEPTSAPTPTVVLSTLPVAE